MSNENQVFIKGVKKADRGRALFMLVVMAAWAALAFWVIGPPVYQAIQEAKGFWDWAGIMFGCYALVDCLLGAGKYANILIRGEEEFLIEGIVQVKQ